MATSYVWVNLIANSWKASSSSIYGDYLFLCYICDQNARSWSPDKSCFKSQQNIQKNTLAQSTALRHSVCVWCHTRHRPFWDWAMRVRRVCVCKRGGPIVWRGGKPLQAICDKGAGTVLLLLAGRDIYTAPTQFAFSSGGFPVIWPVWVEAAKRAVLYIQHTHKTSLPVFNWISCEYNRQKKQVPVLSLSLLFVFTKGAAAIQAGLCSRLSFFLFFCVPREHQSEPPESRFAVPAPSNSPTLRSSQEILYENWSFHGILGENAQRIRLRWAQQEPRHLAHAHGRIRRPALSRPHRLRFLRRGMERPVLAAHCPGRPLLRRHHRNNGPGKLAISRIN